MKKLLFGILVACSVCACESKSAGPEPVIAAQEAIDVDPPTIQFVSGFVKRANKRATVYRLTTSETVIEAPPFAWITVDVTELDYENDCTRTNGTTYELDTIREAEVARALGREVANDVMDLIVEAPWTGALCPPEEE